MDSRRATMFIIGVCLFLIGAYLVHDMIIKFLKFTIGLVILLISLPLIFGSFYIRQRKVKVVQTVRKNEQ